MFYSPAILAKKGDLSHVWVAAHWHNKLTKQQVQQLDISQSVEQIKKPSVQLSLRLSGQLLHGVARIYQKKVAYLFTDCNEALVKIKMAFRPSTGGAGGGGGLNLAEASTPAKINAPAWDEDDEGEAEVLPKSSSSKRFKNVEIKVDEDDWTKMTPVHTRKSIAKRTPSIDLDYAAAAAAAHEAQTPSAAAGGESWSEFPFMSDEPNSIEVVRRGNDSNVRLSTMSIPQMQTAAGGGEQPQEEYVAPDDMIFGDEFHQQQPPQQTPTTPGQAINTSDLAGLLLLGSKGNSASKLKSTWLQDVESREQEPQVVTSATKKRTGDEAPKTVRKRANVVIELSDDAIKNAMLDTADICLPPGARLLVRDRIRNSRVIQARLLFLPTSNGAPALEQTNLPVCDEIAAKFVAHAKPVPFSSSSSSAATTEDDVEIAREANARGGEEQAPKGEEGDEPKQEEYVPEDAPVFGDDNMQQLEIQQAANHELEETFVEEPTGGNEQQGSEEERWNPQTIKMMKLLREKLTDQPVIAYQDLAQGERKSIVAKAFFEVLQLTTRGMVAVSQQEAFGEILITPGSKYDTLLPTEV
ncbi:hypothetical protein BASA81_013842 [Batrachochytrium salamandrivorans]|nr:hypothetical protein BASA81_013842 [Batrachochytrium salamandrivorans]